MQASWVKDTTATTGTGTITLDGSPASGFIGFDDAFSTGDVVHYTIEDGNNRETGIGTLTSGASWTLSRDQIFETLISGTYSGAWPATGINLSGSATVAIAPSAASVDSPTTSYLHNSSTYEYGDNVTKAGFTTSVTLTADRMYLYPIRLYRPRKISSLAVRIGTIDGTATVSRAGIYKPDESGMPKTLIDDVAIDVATAAVTDETSLSSAVYLPVGLYFMAFATDGTPALYGFKYGQIAGDDIGRDTYCRAGHLYVTLSSWSTLPATISSITDYWANANFPAVGWRP